MKSHLISVGLVGAALGAVGCGDSDPVPPAAATSGPTQEQFAPYLVRNGEEPRFRVVGADGTDDFAGLTSGGGFTDEGKRVLRRAGFLKIFVRRLEGPRGPGLSNVQVFATAEGARRWMAYDLRTDVIRDTAPGTTKVERFRVAGVPGARGWTTDEFANVLWVQGRCLLVLGNAGNPSAVADLAAGVRAIHRRTKGRCA